MYYLSTAKADILILYHSSHQKAILKQQDHNTMTSNGNA